LSAALLLVCGNAHAHSSIKGIGDFYSGMLHPVTAIEQALALAALGILFGRDSERLRNAQLTLVGTLALGGIVGWLWRFIAAEPPQLTNVCILIVLGALIAGAWRIPLWAAHALASLLGGLLGYVSGAEIIAPMKVYVFLPGVLVASFMISTNAEMFVEFLLKQERPWLVIATRVLGSWIAAIGMLVFAISLRRLGTS
jgi:urease accessory protein